MKHKQFRVMVQGEWDYDLDTIPIESIKYDTLMCICSEEGAIYVTKEQAKVFWDLKE